MKTDVLIIGAGPTGLMLANQLQRFGVNFILLDSKKGPTVESRAIALSARSMELYQQLGIEKEVQNMCEPIYGASIFVNGKERARLDVKNYGIGQSDFPDIMNAFEQNLNETILYKNVKSKKNVKWQHEFIKKEQHESYVTATIKNLKTKKNITISARYLIGCDGASSPVRKSSNMNFDGGTYDHRFFVVDAQVEWKRSYNHLIVAPSDSALIIFFPIRGEKRLRIIGTLPPQFYNKKNIDFEEIEEIFKKHSKLDFDIQEVGWYSTYKIHHRCVDSFRDGRIFLAGDSAHIHSPAGGQGMNTGLQDAHNLAWKLAYVLQGKADDKLLDTYNTERLGFAKVLLRTTDTGFKFMAGDSLFERTMRTLVFIPLMKVALKYKKTKARVFKRISQIGYNYSKSPLSKNYSKQKLQFDTGDRFPYTEKGIYKEFNELAFYLVHVSDTPDTSNADIKDFALNTKIIHKKRTAAWKKLGIESDLYILVRPDQYIMTIADDLRDIKTSVDNITLEK